MQSFIMPKMVYNDKSSSGITKTTRENRFNVSFEVGQIGLCVADAERVMQDVLNDLVTRIKNEWKSGNKACGEPAAYTRPTYYYVGGIRRKIKIDEYCKYQNEALNGTLKVPRKNKKNAEQIKDLRAWIKWTRKNYTWNGKVYHPRTDGNMLDYSGLMIDSLKADKVRIRAKTGRCPSQVTCRITVAPSRGESVARRGLLLVQPWSPVWEESEKWVEQCVKRTTVFKRHDDKEKLTLAKMNAIYNRYRNRYMMIAKMVNTAKRFM